MAHNNELILETLRNLLQKRFWENFIELVLFGSRAKGISHSDSDFDLLTIMNEKPDWKTCREISDICYQIDLQFNIITDSHILGITELDTLRGKQPIFENALSNGIYA
jgi:uncharacterized protein